VRISHLIGALLFALSLVACDQSPAPSTEPPLSYPTTRGVYATADPGDPTAADWAGHFLVVEGGDLFGPGDFRAALRDRGTRALGYVWMPAGYHYTDGGEDRPFMQWVVDHRDRATLNPDGPYPHCKAMGYDWCQDYYFDLADAETRARRVDELKKALADADGVFFDWGPGVYIREDAYADMKRTFEDRHPGKTYLAAVGGFYRDLRAALPEAKLIVSNQGFRNPENVLPHVDYDMTESYATDEDDLGRRLYLKGQGEKDVPSTIYYPVSDDFRQGQITDTFYYLDYLAELEKEYAGPRFKGYIYMNYAAPDFEAVGQTADGTPIYVARPPKNAIFYGYAIARLKGWTAYTEVPFDHRLERLDLYFADLGRPLGDHDEDHGAYRLRFYSQGFVLAGAWDHPTELRIQSPHLQDGPVFDLYEKRWRRVRNHALTIALRPVPDPVTGGLAPLGRVFVYPR